MFKKTLHTTAAIIALTTIASTANADVTASGRVTGLTFGLSTSPQPCLKVQFKDINGTVSQVFSISNTSMFRNEASSILIPAAAGVVSLLTYTYDTSVLACSLVQLKTLTVGGIQ